MCLLTFLPENVEPNTTALGFGSVTNDDGHGWAIVIPDENRILIGKSLDAETAIAEFAAARALHLDGPALFHSRFATHGLENITNCHPFRVNGDPRTVVAHNGVLPADSQPRKGDPRSDTAILADTMVNRFGHPRRHRTRRRLEEWMGRGNKLVFLSVDPRMRTHGLILNEKAGKWDQGIWYSNDGYCQPRSYSSGYYHYNHWDSDDPDTWTSNPVGRCWQCGQHMWLSTSAKCWKCHAEWPLSLVAECEMMRRRYEPSKGCVCPDCDSIRIANGEYVYTGPAVLGPPAPKAITAETSMFQKVGSGTATCFKCDALLSFEEIRGGVCSTCETCLDCRYHVALCECVAPVEDEADMKHEDWYSSDGRGLFIAD